MGERLITNDHGIRRIGGGQVVGIQNPVNFRPLGLPGRKQLTGENIADRVMQHVKIIEDIGDGRILCGKTRTVLVDQRHKGPVHRRVPQVMVVGIQDRLDGPLFGGKIRSRAQWIIHGHLQVVIGPDRRVKEREFLSKGFGVGQAVQPVVIEPVWGDGISAFLIIGQDAVNGPILLCGGKVRDINIVCGAMEGMGFVEGVLGPPGQFHIVGSDGFFIRRKSGAGGNKPEGFLPRDIFDGRHVGGPGQQKIFVQMGMAEIDPVEIDIEFLQVVPKGEVPEGPIIKPLIPFLELFAAGEWPGGQEQQAHR